MTEKPINWPHWAEDILQNGGTVTGRMESGVAVTQYPRHPGKMRMILGIDYAPTEMRMIGLGSSSTYIFIDECSSMPDPDFIEPTPRSKMWKSRIPSPSDQDYRPNPSEATRKRLRAKRKKK